MSYVLTDVALIATARKSDLIEWYNINKPESERPVTNFTNREMLDNMCRVMFERMLDQMELEEETEHLTDEEFTARMMAEMMGGQDEADEAEALKAGNKTKAEPKAKAQPRARSNASNSAGVARSWNDNEVRAKRTTRNGVEVNVEGESHIESFRSTNAAFLALGLPSEKHIKFRMALKKAGSATFEHDGKKYEFRII